MPFPYYFKLDFNLNFKLKLLQVALKLKLLEDFTYFKNYFIKIDQVQQGNRNEIAKIYFVRCIILIKAIHFLIFAFFQEKFSNQSNLIQCNIFYLINLPYYFNIWMIFFMLIAIYCSKMFYFLNNGISSRILHQILIKQNNSFFLIANYSTINNRRVSYEKLFLHFYESKNVAKIIKNFSIIILNYLKSSYIIFGMY